MVRQLIAESADRRTDQHHRPQLSNWSAQFLKLISIAQFLNFKLTSTISQTDQQCTILQIDQHCTISQTNQHNFSNWSAQFLKLISIAQFLKLKLISTISQTENWSAIMHKLFPLVKVVQCSMFILAMCLYFTISDQNVQRWDRSKWATLGLIRMYNIETHQNEQR